MTTSAEKLAPETPAAWVLQLDQLIARILMVKPQSVYIAGESAALDDIPKDAVQDVTSDEQGTATTAQRAFSLSLIFSGVRCTLQYMILPFVLPIIGVAGDFSVYISLLINVVAMVAIVFSLRRFWMINYRRKWQYFGVAMFALVLLVSFLVLDVAHIMA